MSCLVDTVTSDSSTPWTIALRAPLSMGILQAEIREWLPRFPSGVLPNSGIEPRSPTLQADSLPSEPPGEPMNTGVGSLSLLQGDLSNPGIEPGSPALQADSLPPGSSGKPSTPTLYKKEKTKGLLTVLNICLLPLRSLFVNVLFSLSTMPFPAYI